MKRARGGRIVHAEFERRTSGESLYFQDMTNLVQVSTSGQVRAKTPLGTIVGDKEVVTSSDLVRAFVERSKLVGLHSICTGTRLFERTFGEPNTALFLYDLRKPGVNESCLFRTFEAKPPFTMNV